METLNEVLKHCELSANSEFRDQIKTLDSNDGSKTQVDKIKRKSSQKVFVLRDSVLTSLMTQVPHVKTVYHMLVVTLILLTLNTAAHDYFTEGNINFGQRTVLRGMSKYWLAIILWCAMQCSVFVVYFGLRWWGQIRNSLDKRLQQLWDAIGLMAYVSFQLTFIFAGSYSGIKLHLGYISLFSVMMELTRFVMKTYAFVRTNVPRIVQGKIKVDDGMAPESPSLSPANNASYPAISQFLYYMFAPTFIYRDNYPRTSRIDWYFAGRRLLEVFGVIFFSANIYERYLQPNFGSFGSVEITIGDLIDKYFAIILPSILLLVVNFKCIIHSWLNFTSELLRFSDRMFYKEWWNATNYEEYYRTWNIVVQDWLYEFVYKEVLNNGGSKCRAFFTVFLLSAAAHELILAISMGFFYPITFIFFGIIGVGFVFLTRNMNKTAGNIFLWFTLPVGISMIYSLYLMEIYARENCPIKDGTWINYFVPVSWNCNGIKWYK